MPNENIANYTYLASNTHHKKSLTIEPVTVLLVVLNKDKRGESQLSLIGSPLRPLSPIAPQFSNGIDSIQKKESGILKEEERKRRTRNRKWDRRRRTVRKGNGKICLNAGIYVKLEDAKLKLKQQNTNWKSIKRLECR